MNLFFLRGFKEYKRQTEMKKFFVRWAERLRSVLVSVDKTTSGGESSERTAYYQRASLMLMPLIEIAWADGRVTRRESDVIVQAAEIYELVDGSTGNHGLMENLLSRPAPSKVGDMWQGYRHFIEDLPEDQRQIVTFCLLAQAQFVAEQSSDSIIGFLRGERIGKDEQEAVRLVAIQLENAKEAAVELDIKKIVAARLEEEKLQREFEAPSANGDYFGEAGRTADLDDYSCLIPLVPLVKTAWAEGRVTKRERHLIFEAADRMGIEPGSTAHERLAEWLEMHPTEEFYDSALDVLRQSWQPLDTDEKSRRKFDLLNDCTLIAESSGGARNFPGGGVKICDEEIAVIKHIAKKIDVAEAAA